MVIDLRKNSKGWLLLPCWRFLPLGSYTNNGARVAEKVSSPAQLVGGEGTGDRSRVSWSRSVTASRSALGNACFLSPLSQARELPLPRCPRHIKCTHGGTALPIWLVRTTERAEGVNREHPANVNQTLCHQGRGHLLAVAAPVPSAHPSPFFWARPALGRHRGKPEKLAKPNASPWWGTYMWSLCPLDHPVCGSKADLANDLINLWNLATG